MKTYLMIAFAAFAFLIPPVAQAESRQAVLAPQPQAQTATGSSQPATVARLTQVTVAPLPSPKVQDPLEMVGVAPLPSPKW